MEKSKKTSTKRLKLVSSILAVVALMLTIGFAWYTYGNKHADTDSLQIMTPYVLYLLNSDASDTLELNVGGIHPGETKQIVVCVSSHDANASQEQTSKDGVFPYSLELVHTDNIGLVYELYPLTTKTAEEYEALATEEKVVSSFVTSDGLVDTVHTSYFQRGSKLTGSTTITGEYRNEMYGADNVDSVVNKGTYCVYTEDSFKLSLSDEEQRYQYYLIEIQWDVNETEEKSKETDLIYLVAKAGVPEPVEGN